MRGREKEGERRKPCSSGELWFFPCGGSPPWLGKTIGCWWSELQERGEELAEGNKQELLEELFEKTNWAANLFSFQLERLTRDVVAASVLFFSFLLCELHAYCCNVVLLIPTLIDLLAGIVEFHAWKASQGVEQAIRHSSHREQ